MNQIQFETSKVFGVFVKLPDGAKAWKNERYYIMRLPKAINLPNENYKILGFVSELTDEQKEGVVDSYHNEVGSLYVDYSTNTYQFMKVSKSFASLLTSLNVLLVNPLQDEWDEVCTWGHGSNITYAEYMEVGKNVGKWILLTCNK